MQNILRERLQLASTDITGNGLLEPENQKPQRLRSAAADRLKSDKFTIELNTFSSGNMQSMYFLH